MPSSSSAELRRRLREADADELEALVTDHAEELDAATLAPLFRNPFLDGELIERVLSLPRVRRAYAARREAVAHPRTPRPLALQLVGGLFWRDLVRVGADTRLHPVVRRSAERRLVERLPAMAVGERMAVARGAGPGVLSTLRFDPSPRVIAALLENPRLTEAMLVPLAAHEGAAPQVLALLARDRRWGPRAALKRALCLNPATPVATALAALPGLDKPSLAAVAAAPRVAPVVRRRAELLAGGTGSRPGV